MSDIDVNRKNFCSDLNLTSKLISRERCLIYAPLTDEIRSKAHSCTMGVLVTMVDVAGSDPVLAAWNPDWTATQDLSVHKVEQLADGPVVVDTRILRQGSRIIFVAADIYDSHGIDDLDQLQANIDATKTDRSSLTLTARSIAAFTRISRAGTSGVDSYDPNKWVGELRRRTSNLYNTEMLNERIGLKIIDANAGLVEIANTPYVSNSIGTINGGVQAMVVEAAAEAMRPGMVASDIQIHFLSQLKVGPAQTRGTVVRDAWDHSVIMIQLLDVGAGDKILAVSTLTLQRIV